MEATPGFDLHGIHQPGAQPVRILCGGHDAATAHQQNRCPGQQADFPFQTHQCLSVTGTTQP